MKSQRLSILTLVLVLALVAVLTPRPRQTDEQLRAGALDAYLATLPGPSHLYDHVSRGMVFFGGVHHPDGCVEFAKENGMSPEMVKTVFEMPDLQPLPAGLSTPEVTLQPMDTSNFAAPGTKLAVTPIALNESRDQALFGVIYLKRGVSSVNRGLVWLQRNGNTWFLVGEPASYMGE